MAIQEVIMPPEEENRLNWPLGQQHEWGTSGYWDDIQQQQRQEYDAREASIKAQQEALQSQQASPPPPPPPPSDNTRTRTRTRNPNPNLHGKRKGLGFKALILTIPLALIPFGITYSSAGGTRQQHLPLWQSVVLAVLIAAIGVPKWRLRAIGFLVLALIIFWILGG
jgi:hypothetical protein